MDDLFYVVVIVVHFVSQLHVVLPSTNSAGHLPKKTIFHFRVRIFSNFFKHLLRKGLMLVAPTPIASATSA